MITAKIFEKQKIVTKLLYIFEQLICELYEVRLKIANEKGRLSNSYCTKAIYFVTFRDVKHFRNEKEIPDKILESSRIRYVVVTVFT